MYAIHAIILTYAEKTFCSIRVCEMVWDTGISKFKLSRILNKYDPNIVIFWLKNHLRLRIFSFSFFYN